MLKFFGDGGAFDVDRGSNCAFYKTKDTLILIDAGFGCFEKIIKFQLLKDVKKVEIFITHMHGDHVASLGSLIDYLKCSKFFFDKVIDYKVFFPNTEKMVQFLKFMNHKTASEYVFKPDKSKFVKKTFVQEHIDDSYGYLFKLDGQNVYYSGDTKHINEDVLKLLKKGKIDYFYHETTNATGLPHTNIEELKSLIPLELRDGVYCMHLNDETSKLVRENGFNLVDLVF